MVARALRDRLRPVCDRIEVAGAVRRGVSVIRSIEFVAIPKFRESADVYGADGGVVNLLWSALDGICEEDGYRYVKAGERYRQLRFCGNGIDIKIDFFTAEFGNWGWVYVLRTGSKEFTRDIIKDLNAAGYVYKGSWIRPLESPDSNEFVVRTPREDDVFRLARRKMVLPKQRDMASTVDA